MSKLIADDFDSIRHRLAELEADKRPAEEPKAWPMYAAAASDYSPEQDVAASGGAIWGHYSAPEADCALTTVNGSHQSGSGLMVNPLYRPLTMGDIIMIDGIYAWSLIDNQPSSQIREFVVTAKAALGDTVVFIYPSLIAEHDSRYRTVVSLPLNGAALRIRPQLYDTLDDRITA